MARIGKEDSMLIDITIKGREYLDAHESDDPTPPEVYILSYLGDEGPLEWDTVNLWLERDEWEDNPIIVRGRMLRQGLIEGA